ncbi:hypothetical protein D3C71_1612780 [compost metagenome]
MHLRDARRQALGQARNNGRVVAAGGHHHLVGGERALAGQDREGLVGRGARHLVHRHAFERRRVHMGDKALEPGVDLFLDHETVGIIARIAPAGQVALPVRGDQTERVPALAAPAVHQPVLFQHQVIDAALLQVVAQRQAGLAAADDGNAVVGGVGVDVGHGGSRV